MHNARSSHRGEHQIMSVNPDRILLGAQVSRPSGSTVDAARGRS